MSDSRSPPRRPRLPTEQRAHVAMPCISGPRISLLRLASIPVADLVGERVKKKRQTRRGASQVIWSLRPTHERVAWAPPAIGAFLEPRRAAAPRARAARPRRRRHGSLTHSQILWRLPHVSALRLRVRLVGDANATTQARFFFNFNTLKTNFKSNTVEFF